MNTKAKRIVFGNLIIYRESNALLVNLFSFRRKLISISDLDMLFSVERKLTDGIALDNQEGLLYEELLRKKQILTSEIIEQADLLREKAFAEKTTRQLASFTISPSFDCNFKCAYCYQKDFEKNLGSMTAEHVDSIYDFLADYHKKVNEKFMPEHISINGGETLLEKNIPVINRILTKFDACPEIMLFTNGVNILKFSSRIDFTKIKKIQVSLDGYDELISKINGYKTPVFDEITKGILYLADLGVEVSVVCMLTPALIASFSRFVHELDKKGLTKKANVKIRLSLVRDFGQDKLDANFLTAEKYLALRPSMTEKTKNTNIHIDNFLEMRQISQILFGKTNEEMWGAEHICKSKPLMFAPNGKIYWCTCTDPQKGVIGEYFPNSWLDEELLSQHIQRSIYSIPQCKKCDFRYICGGGCVLFNVKQDKSVNSPYCGYFKDEFFLVNLEKFL